MAGWSPRGRTLPRHVDTSMTGKCHEITVCERYRDRAAHVGYLSGRSGGVVPDGYLLNASGRHESPNVSSYREEFSGLVKKCLTYDGEAFTIWWNGEFRHPLPSRNRCTVT